MIDYIRVYYRDKRVFEPFVNNEENFSSIYKVLEAHTGEISYPYRTQLENMDLRITEKSGWVFNSIHKLHNVLKTGYDHNANDFTYSNLIETINHLTKRIINIERTSLTGLEFGLNIHTDLPAEDIIKNNVLMHNFKNYNHNRKFNGKGKLFQFDHSNYLIKIYDKAKQYDITGVNILRFEVKFINRKAINKLGVFNISDLISKENLRRLFLDCLKRFDEMIIVDSINDSNSISDKHRSKLREYLNPNFWEIEMKTKSRQTKSRKVKEFKNILSEYNLESTKEKLRTLLVEKFIFLINN